LMDVLTPSRRKRRTRLFESAVSQQLAFRRRWPGSRLCAVPLTTAKKKSYNQKEGGKDNKSDTSPLPLHDTQFNKSRGKYAA
jgi:hypothetical protein